ncbi:MAG: hypothetical protein JJU29_02465 [Verrucomicrobia bacterium]|nr:hypothetical protein [Verrucomicrobiota bacterium]MCH8511200.1 hypothetical protein [Kiritimatiellia bacterium]
MKTRTTIMTICLMTLGLHLSAQERPADRPQRGRGPERSEEARGGRDRSHPVLERWMNHLSENDPDEHARLMELREEDPRAFREAVREGLNEVRRQHRQDRQQRMFGEQVDAIRNAETDEERQEAVEALKLAVGEMVERRMEMREQRIASVREQLERLESEHQTDKDRQQELVENYVEQLLAEPEEAPEENP